MELNHKYLCDDKNIFLNNYISNFWEIIFFFFEFFLVRFK